MSGLELCRLARPSIEWIFSSVRMVCTDLRLHFLELIQLVELFSAFRWLHCRLIGYPWNLILRHCCSSCVVTWRLGKFLKFLLRDYGLFFACMVEVSYSTIDVFNNCSNRGRRPIRHTIRVLDILGLLIITHHTLIVRAKLASLIALLRSRVA